ncbi:hypothetical protein ACJRO7_005341 [Eucalyptus globulus]|uniref:peptide-methionine (S)-S-oxide reductase n=1 Tax=Eucalyptus globulus TaxID=34317 RepID=A0ABD3J5I5_EUCGL
MEELWRPRLLSETRSIRLSRGVPVSLPNLSTLLVLVVVVLASVFSNAQCIRFANRIPDPPAGSPNQPSRIAVEYDPRLTSYRQFLDVFWSSHDSRQALGQGPDVESRLAALSKEREQSRSKGSVVTTQIQHLETFYHAEPEHQKFELKQGPLLLQLMGNLPEEELQKSTELCPSHIQKQIDAKIGDIVRKNWPVLRCV